MFPSYLLSEKGAKLVPGQTLSSLQIVRAEAADANGLTSIAVAAKRSWGYPEAWLEQWRPLLTITSGFVSAHPTFIARVGAESVGFYALDADSGEWELEHLWVQPGWMGHGVGGTLFTHAVDMVRVAGAHRLSIESDPFAEGFYLRMGAQRVGERTYDLAGTERVLPLLALQL